LQRKSNVGGIIMRIVARITLIITLLLGLTGCYGIIVTPNIATAIVYGPNVPIRSLRPQQVAQLSSWIKAHDAGWRGLMETPPVAQTMRIVVHEPDSQQGYFDLFLAKDGTATMYYYAPRPALPLKRYLPEADVSTLWEAIAK
jgi:hypothetical protein